MEALVAIGLIGNIITFIDYGIKITSKAKEIKASASGVTVRNADLNSLAIHIKEQATIIALKRPTAPADAFEAGLMGQANECLLLSTQLQELIQRITSSKPGSRRQNMKAIYRNYVRNEEKDGLAKKLHDCKSRLQLQLIAVEG